MNIDELIQGLPNQEKTFIGAYLNVHVGKDNGGFKKFMAAKNME